MEVALMHQGGREFKDLYPGEGKSRKMSLKLWVSSLSAAHKRKESSYTACVAVGKNEKKAEPCGLFLHPLEE